MSATPEWRRRTPSSNAHLWVGQRRPICGANIDRVEASKVPDHIGLALCCSKCVSKATGR